MKENSNLPEIVELRETLDRLHRTTGLTEALVDRLEKALAALQQDKPVKIALDLEGGNIALVNTDDIMYIERQGLDVLVKTSKKTFRTNINLKDFERKLDPAKFFRSHKGCIVRLDLIEEIIHSGRTFELLLNTGEKVPLSREKEKQLRTIYGIS